MADTAQEIQQAGSGGLAVGGSRAQQVAAARSGGLAVGGSRAQQVAAARSGGLAVGGRRAGEIDAGRSGAPTLPRTGPTAVELSVARPGKVVGGSPGLSAPTRRLVATVRSRFNYLRCVLTTDSARALERVRSEAGSGSIEVHIDEPESICFVCGDRIGFTLDGEPIGGFVVEQIEYALQPRDGNPSSRLLRVSGRAFEALLDEAIVYPELGSGRLSPRSRLMNWTSGKYQVLPPWTAATQIKRQGDTTGQWDGAPLDWPDPDAYWIWSRPQGAGSPPQPVGKSYFRSRFTLSRPMAVTIFVTADDGYELYLDATLVASETRAFMWAETQTYDVYLDAGSHTIGIAGINIERPNVSTNVAGVICSIVERTEGGQSFGSVIHRTDNSWYALDYPVSSPGMTAGEIMRILVEEAQERGGLTGIVPLFTRDQDSLGQSFTTTIDFELAIGTTLLQVARMLSERGWETGIRDGQHLLMWGAGVRRSFVAFYDNDFHERSITATCPPVTTGLAAWHTGDAPANFQTNDRFIERIGLELAAFGRKEAYVELGAAASETEATIQMDAILAEQGRLITRHVADLRADHSDLLVSWEPGVWITTTDRMGVPVWVRVESVAVTDAPGGGPDPVVRYEATEMGYVLS